MGWDSSVWVCVSRSCCICSSKLHDDDNMTATAGDCMVVWLWRRYGEACWWKKWLGMSTWNSTDPLTNRGRKLTQHWWILSLMQCIVILIFMSCPFALELHFILTTRTGEYSSSSSYESHFYKRESSSFNQHYHDPTLAGSLFHCPSHYHRILSR